MSGKTSPRGPPHHSRESPPPEMAIVEEVLGIEGGACDRHAGREEEAGQEEDAGAIDKRSSELLYLP